MSYKKPQIVAKSVAKQSFVAGCAANKMVCHGCMANSAAGSATNRACNTGVAK